MICLLSISRTNSDLLNSLQDIENKSFQDSSTQLQALPASSIPDQDEDDDSETSLEEQLEQAHLHFCPATFDMMKNKMQGDFVSYYYLYVSPWHPFTKCSCVVILFLLF